MGVNRLLVLSFENNADRTGDKSSNLSKQQALDAIQKQCSKLIILEM